MCNCDKTPGFKEKLREADSKTKTTGDVHVVYVHKASNSVFIRKEKDLNDSLGICCYFLPDGTEVIYVKKAKEPTDSEEKAIEKIKNEKSKPQKKIISKS